MKAILQYSWHTHHFVVELGIVKIKTSFGFFFLGINLRFLSKRKLFTFNCLLKTSFFSYLLLHYFSSSRWKHFICLRDVQAETRKPKLWLFRWSISSNLRVPRVSKGFPCLWSVLELAFILQEVPDECISLAMRAQKSVVVFFEPFWGKVFPARKELVFVSDQFMSSWICIHDFHQITHDCFFFLVKGRVITSCINKNQFKGAEKLCRRKADAELLMSW